MISGQNTLRNKFVECGKVKKLLDEVPFFIRFVIITKLILFTISLFTQFFIFYFSNIPLYSIKHYQLWRLITTSFLTTNIINMLIGFIIWLHDSISLEKSIGTIRYIFIFITNSIFINIIYCLIIFFIGYIKKDKLLLEIYKINNSGIWPIIICELTVLCLNNPDSQIMFFFTPCPMKAKYYPFFIIIIYNLMNDFKMNYDVISGFFYGVIYYYCFQNKINISDKTVKKIENSFCCKYLVGHFGFVSIDNININININAMSSGDVHMINSFDNNQNEFSPFQGKDIPIGANNNYIAVNEQNQNNNNTLDEINTENNN